MALTDFNVAIIGKNQGDRVVVVADDPRMRGFLEEHERYVVSSVNNLIRVSGDIKGKPYSAELLPEVVRCIARCAHEIVGKRNMQSLATEPQLVRARQLDEILTKRMDNSILLPENPDKFTHGQIGRWISDAKHILIAEGRWDDAKKCEIPKEGSNSSRSN